MSDMQLMLNDILHLDSNAIKNSKIELNMTAGRGGESFLDRWLKHDDKDKETGTCSDCSYWGWYSKNRRNFQPGNFVFSFVQMPDNEWLFISAARVADVPKNSFAKVKILSEYSALFGRLIVRYKKGNTFSLYTFKMDHLIEDMTVKEVLPCLYSGELFDGYDNVCLPYSKLADIFSGKLSPTYYEALKKITGIYCLTDTKTGKLYIGSATGEDGIAQRWGAYLDSKHGGNTKLKKLFKQKGDLYFERYFTFTLLEYYGLSYDTEKIIKREQYWKKCLSTIEHGYNDN